MNRTMTFMKLAAFAAALLAVNACDENTLDDDLERKPRIARVSGDNQVERVGYPLPEPLVVEVTTNLGSSAIEGVEVVFRTGDAGASVSPPTAVTDGDGRASCEFTLGSGIGLQHVTASIEGDSTRFVAVAEEVGCAEEGSVPACGWPQGHLFITTTNSSLISTGASVLIDFDPASGTAAEVLETDSTLIDLAFSPRGDLYVSTRYGVYKVDPAGKQMAAWGSYPRPWNAEIEPNVGGILAGVAIDALFTVWCTPAAVVEEVSIGGLTIRTGNLAVHPVTRDLFLIDGIVPTYRLFTAPWDGRSDLEAPVFTGVYINNAAADPAGMCADSTGTVYICFNSLGNYRRIVAVSAGGEVDDDFFDFYANANNNSTAAGQWGDIAILGERLYLIDKRNDMLVEISTDGAWLRDWEDDAFSRPLGEDERYGIAAVPVLECQ